MQGDVVNSIHVVRRVMASKNFSLMIHGVTVGKIRDAFTKTYSKKRIRHPNCKADPPRWGVIGLDCQARVLELVVVKLHSGDVLIVHANYLTPGSTQGMRNT